MPSVLVLNFFSLASARFLFVNYTEQFTMHCLAVRQRILKDVLDKIRYCYIVRLGYVWAIGYCASTW
jgi:hypothetical protein